MIDIVLLLVAAAMAYLVAGEGAWGAALTLLCVVFGGLLAMNFFEPLANFLSAQMPNLSGYWDFVSLVGLFAFFVTALRLATDQLAPTNINIPGNTYLVARWVCGAATGYITMAFLLTALHTAPLPREFLGFTAERKNLFSVTAPDRQWLGFTQYVSEHVFRSGSYGRIFDGPRYPPRGMKVDKDGNVWSSFPIRYASRRDQLAGRQPVRIAPTAPPAGGGAAPPPAF